MQKKKSATSSSSANAKAGAHCLPPFFCDGAGAKVSALGGIALRVLMSDIRKHKLGGDEATDKAACGFETDIMPENK